MLTVASMIIAGLPPGNELNNREWATLIWLGVAVAIGLWTKAGRNFALALLRFATAPVVAFSILAMWVWTAGVVLIAERLHVWTGDLVKDTVIWAAGPALALFYHVTRMSKDPLGFRRVVFDTIKLSVLVEFYVNLHVFSLVVELLLLPTVTFAALLAAFAATDEKYRLVMRVLNVVLACVGIALLILVTATFISNWRQEDPWHDLRELALPIWLTAGVVPYLYGLSLYFNYQGAFLRIDWHAKDNPAARRRAKLGLLLGLNFRTHLVGNLGGHWLNDLVDAPTFKEVRDVVRRYRAAPDWKAALDEG